MNKMLDNGSDFWDKQASQHAMQPAPVSVNLHIWPLDWLSDSITRFLVQWIAASFGGVKKKRTFFSLPNPVNSGDSRQVTTGQGSVCQSCALWADCPADKRRARPATVTVTVRYCGRSCR